MASYFGYNSMVPQPYQPQVTPFPQNAAYGVGAGANTLVSNLIAAALYQQQQQQDQQQLALQRLQVLDKFGPGAYRAPGVGQMFQQAGMPIQPSQIPLSKDEIESLATQQFWKAHPEYVGWSPAMIVEDMKRKTDEARRAESYRQAGAFWGAPGGQQGSPITEDFSIPGARPGVGPQGPVTEAAPMGAPQSGGQVTRKIVFDPDKGAISSIEQGPTPVSIQEQQAAAQAVAAARSQILQEARGGKKFYGPNNEVVTLPELAKLYKVTVSDLVNGISADAARMQGHKLPAEAPSMRSIQSEHQRRVTEEQRNKEYQLTEKRLKEEARRVDQLIAQGNRAQQIHNDLLAKQSMDAARDAATKALNAAKFMYEQNENDIKINSMGKPTPEQEEKRRTLGAAVTDWVTRLQSMVPAANRAAGSGRSTPFQGGTPTGRGGYPSNWFNNNPVTPQVAPPGEAPVADIGDEDAD